jgi:hypothetical protein
MMIGQGASCGTSTESDYNGDAVFRFPAFLTEVKAVAYLMAYHEPSDG